MEDKPLTLKDRLRHAIWAGDVDLVQQILSESGTDAAILSQMNSLHCAVCVGKQNPQYDPFSRGPVLMAVRSKALL